MNKLNKIDRFIGRVLEIALIGAAAFAAVALAAFVALLCAAAGAGIGPHFGWI